MYNPIQIQIVNFLSHPDSLYKFPVDQLSLIFGDNQDDIEEGANSNGSGKSAIIEAITLALTGEVYRDINREDFIMEGKKNCSIEFLLEHSVTKDRIRIVRSFTKSKAEAVIFVNDVEQKQITTIPETNKWILDTIGVSREDLLNYYIINQDNKNSFFTTGDTKQKEIISRFANYSSVDQVIKKLTEEKEVFDTDLKKLDKNKTSIEFAEAEIQSLIEVEKEALLKTVESETQPFLLQIESNEVEIEGDKSQIENLLTKITETLAKIEENKTKLQEFDDIKKLKLDYQKEIESVEDNISKKNSKVRKLKALIASAIECPKCSHQFVHEEEVDIEKTKTELQVEEKATLDLKSELTTLEDNLELIKESLKDSDVIKKEGQSLLNSLEEYKAKKVQKERNIKLLDQQNATLISKVEAILNNNKTSNLSTLEEKLINYQADLIEVSKQIADLKDKSSEKEFWIHHLGKKGFQTYLANQCIKTIETHCNSYLQKMNSNLSVKLSGYKKLANGDLRDKIDVSIVKSGLTTGKFAKYSGGQKERVNLAGVLTFHNLFNSSLNGKGLNLLCLDESLDHLDEKGQKKCLEILKLFKITTMVITHGHASTLLNGFKQTIVRYKNGESKIV